MSFSKSLAVSSLRPKTAAGVARLNQQASLLTANSSCVLERPSTSPSILQSLVLEDSEERASSTIIRGSKVEDPVPLWGFSMPDVVAFSDSSLKSAAYAGLYDYDSNNTLLSYRKKVNLSERTSNLLLRNPKVAAQVKIPKTSELSTAEVSFGAQKVLSVCYIKQSLNYLIFLGSFCTRMPPLYYRNSGQKVKTLLGDR